MTLRVLLFAAVFLTIFSGALSRMKVPRDGKALKVSLKYMGRKPGTLGYFNSAYMAFTREEADKLPNLVSLRSRMRKMKTDNMMNLNNRSLSLQSDTLIKKRNRISKIKRYSSFPVTTSSGPCESTIGGLERLCEVCPAVTDLGPNKIPRYINEVLCGSEASCGAGEFQGLCQNPTVVQDFLMVSGSSRVVYSQPIRVCCECGLLSA